MLKLIALTGGGQWMAVPYGGLLQCRALSLAPAPCTPGLQLGGTLEPFPRGIFQALFSPPSSDPCPSFPSPHSILCSCSLPSPFGPLRFCPKAILVLRARAAL